MKKAKRETNLIDELKAALKIDKNDLDNELVIQRELKGRISLLLENAKSDVRDLKAEIDIAHDELYVQFKHKADESDSKTTEGYIKAQVGSSRRMVDLIRELGAAERKQGEMQALYEEVKERGYDLRGLIDLYHDQYWQQEEGKSKRRGEAVEREATRQLQTAGRRMNRNNDD